MVTCFDDFSHGLHCWRWHTAEQSSYWRVRRMSMHIMLLKLLSTNAVHVNVFRFGTRMSCSIHLDMWHKLRWLRRGFFIDRSTSHPQPTQYHGPPHLETCEFSPRKVLTLSGQTMFPYVRNAMRRLKTKQEAFEKCWAHSPLWADACPFTRCC